MLHDGITHVSCIEFVVHQHKSRVSGSRSAPPATLVRNCRLYFAPSPVSLVLIVDYRVLFQRFDNFRIRTRNQNRESRNWCNSSAPVMARHPLALHDVFIVWLLLHRFLFYRPGQSSPAPPDLWKTSSPSPRGSSVSLARRGSDSDNVLSIAVQVHGRVTPARLPSERVRATRTMVPNRYLPRSLFPNCPVQQSSFGNGFDSTCDCAV